MKSVGVRGLFSGLQPALLGTAVSQGVYFYLYSLLRDLAVARKHAAAGTSSLQSSREQELPIGSVPPSAPPAPLFPAPTPPTQDLLTHACALMWKQGCILIPLTLVHTNSAASCWSRQDRMSSVAKSQSS